MVRSELLQGLCNHHPSLVRKDVEKIFEVIFSEITESLCMEKNIEIRGFGIFKTKLRKARMGRNPKTLKIIPIPAKKAVKWKMSKTLFNRLNEI